MSKKKVSYRGIEVLDGWPEKIQEAQLISTCNPNGVEMERVRYGSEAEDWGADEGPCPDCNVVKGEFHVPGCDVERCPACGGQLMMGCDCNDACNTKKIHKPFSKRDQRIVDARRKFKWRHVGFAENGDAIFEVANHIYRVRLDQASNRRLFEFASINCPVK